MTELKKWAGSFSEDEHRYFREDGKELVGVTGILHRKLFTDEYRGVPQEILSQAASRGKAIHSRIELYDMTGMGNDIFEVQHYAILKDTNGLEHIASEYFVSDDEYCASAIDKVYHREGTPDNVVVLGDVKTTSKFNREYVSWQLSIYAYFFEMMNPGLVVGDLIGIWLREKDRIAKVIPVERKPVELVRELIRCDREDVPFEVDMLPGYITENLDRLVWIKQTIKALTEEQEELTADILSHMQQDKKDKVDAGVILFTRKAGAMRTTFDTKAFKEDHKDLYEQYAKTKQGNETLQVNLRD